MDRHQNIGFLLKDVSRRYVARFEAHARSISLTIMQCKVLVSLEKSEGASQTRLCEVTDTDPMMMVRILNKMEEEKLLERRPDPADKRAFRLYLTPKARPLLDEIWRLAALVRAEMFADIAKPDRDTLLRVLEKAHSNLVAIEREPTETSRPRGTARNA